jgi:hypothetical protein
VLRIAPRAAALQVYGTYALDDTDRALTALAETLPITVHRALAAGRRSSKAARDRNQATRRPRMGSPVRTRGTAMPPNRLPAPCPCKNEHFARAVRQAMDAFGFCPLSTFVESLCMLHPCPLPLRALAAAPWPAP